MKTKLLTLIVGLLIAACISHLDAAPVRLIETQYSRAAAVTTSDTATIVVTNALYIGVAGDVKVDLIGAGTAIVFKAVPVGVLPIRATRVYSTGTTATNIVALRN